MDQSAIDTAIQHYYTHLFDESARLTTRSAQGALEHVRVQEMVAERIAPGSRVVDVGGATGVHAAALAAQGHEVTLVDPVAAQVEAARRHGTFTALVGDARRLQLESDAYDVALLLGPLYHLRSVDDRLLCLREAARVVRPGGLVFCAAIPRLARHATLSAGSDVPLPYPQYLVALLGSGSPPPGGRFPGGHFHTCEELAQELLDAGLLDVEVHAVEGVGGLALEQVAADDPLQAELLAAALTLVRRTGHLPGVRDLSNHVLAIGRVAGASGGHPSA